MGAMKMIKCHKLMSYQYSEMLTFSGNTMPLIGDKIKPKIVENMIFFRL